MGGTFRKVAAKLLLVRFVDEHEVLGRGGPRLMCREVNGARIRPAPAILVPAPTAYPPASSTLRVIHCKTGPGFGQEPTVGTTRGGNWFVWGEFATGYKKDTLISILFFATYT